ncbi:RNA 2',3'-cyclic phosphodiesterase [Mesobacillus harenae]|uniref:RNA 2',3'-cyclic phosphodiesterase n=1 Tax=Mesobacillus harenae TaxID=2213203 RepID=UPI00157FF6CC
MHHKNHYFIALAIPFPMKTEIMEKIHPLKEEFRFQRWVHPQDLHITLAFLGDASEQKLKLVSENTIDEIDEFSSFSVSIDHLGVFGNSSSPRIFWAGMLKSIALYELRERVYTAASKANFELESRPFNPHVTLARKWEKSRMFDSSLLEDNNPFNKEPLTFVAREVVLYKTHLGKEPKYEAIASIPLMDK